MSKAGPDPSQPFPFSIVDGAEHRTNLAALSAEDQTLWVSAICRALGQEDPARKPVVVGDASFGVEEGDEAVLLNPLMEALRKATPAPAPSTAAEAKDGQTAPNESGAPPPPPAVSADGASAAADKADVVATTVGTEVESKAAAADGAEEIWEGMPDGDGAAEGTTTAAAAEEKPKTEEDATAKEAAPPPEIAATVAAGAVGAAEEVPQTSNASAAADGKSGGGPAVGTLPAAEVPVAPTETERGRAAEEKPVLPALDIPPRGVDVRELATMEDVDLSVPAPAPPPQKPSGGCACCSIL